MAAIDFKELATFVNLSGSTQLDEKPTDKKEGRWALYRGRYRVHLSTYDFAVLYFLAAASLEDVGRALRATQQYSIRHIVYAPTLERTIKRDDVEQTLRNAGIHNTWTTREYLVSFIRNEVNDYLRRIEDLAPKDYVDPHIKTPSGFSSKYPNPILAFLLDVAREDEGKLGIVLAEPGQGKTYMSRYVVAQVAKSSTGAVPLLVDSSQWNAMALDDQRSLYKTIANSFRHFGAPISWLDGHEDQFLRLSLKADLFTIVFDGFDEYVLRNRGEIQPMEVLRTLQELTQSTGARIVLTSRTSFWRANLPDREIERFVDKSRPQIFQIEPFNINQAKNYFEHKLRRPKHADVALRMYTTLRNIDEDFAGRGFVLSLVADLATEAERRSEALIGPTDPRLWLTEALCQRETLRQNLDLTATDQIDVFRAFAIELIENPELPGINDLLELVITAVRPTLSSASMASTIDKLKSHPLLEYARGSGTWTFRQEQIRLSLVAQEILSASGDRLSRFVQRARLDAESWQDLATVIVDTIYRTITPEQVESRVSDVVAAFAKGDYTSSPISPGGENAARMSGMLAMAAVDKLLPHGSSREDRAGLLCRISGGSSAQHLTLTGTLASFDFRNIRFVDCKFERVVWANCRFDEATVFDACTFIGGAPPAHCVGFGSTQMVNCVLDAEAAAMINNERIRESRKRYDVEDLKSDINSVLQRFIGRGGVGVRAVEASVLGRGPISGSRHKDEILEALRSTILEQHALPGSQTGYNVRADAVEALRFYAANNVYTGPIRDAYERLIRKLDLH